MINVYPMATESHGPNAYEDFIREEGCPTLLRRDNSKMQTGVDFTNINRHYCIKDGYTEPHHPHQNPAENQAVRWLKDHCQVVMNNSGAPNYMWSYCMLWISEIHNLTAHEALNYRTPFEHRHGATPDISAYLMFTFWEKILYLDPESKYPSSKEAPGRFLGVARSSGDALTFVVLSEHDTVLVRSVIRSANGTPLAGFPNKRSTHEFYSDQVEPPYPDHSYEALPHNRGGDIQEGDDGHEDVSKNSQHFEGQEEREKEQEGENNQTQELQFSRKKGKMKQSERHKGNSKKRSKFTKYQGNLRRSPRHTRQNIVRKADSYSLYEVGKLMIMIGLIIVTNIPIAYFGTTVKPRHEKLLGLDTLLKDDTPEMSDDPKHKKLRQYHQMLESMSEAQDSEDHYTQYVWKVDKVVSHHKNGRQTYLHVKWKQGNYTYITLRSLMNHDMYATMLYAVRKRLADQPEWDWVNDFVEDTKKYQGLVCAMKTSRAFGPKYKFGVEVPRSIKHALEIDKRNGNDLWREAIQKELKQLDQFKVFRLRNQGEDISEYQRLPYHMVFDVKFDLRRKARLVVGGNFQQGPKDESYSGVVSLTAVRILFLLATMNCLHLWAADVGNAFLNGITRDKLFIVAGPEFGPDLAGKILIMYKSIYGARSSCARFHENLADKLLRMGFKPSKADQDLWFRDKGDHYEYIGTYVDDLLIASKNPQGMIDDLKEQYVLKGVGIPEYYLGGNVIPAEGRWKEESVDWILAADTYTTNVIKKFEELMANGKPDCPFPTFRTPMDSNYHPEEDDTPLLDMENVTRYQAMVGSLNWAISIGRFDIQYATTTMARYSHAPREGHMKAVKRIFGYLKKFNKARLPIDPELPRHEDFPYDDLNTWQDLYPDAEEEVPPDMPKAKGPKVRLTVWVDADHARDKVTCRSVTGIVIMANSTVVRTYCKRQATVESSTYGSELVAARIATDLALEMRYVFKMLGVPIDGSVLMLGDNKSVVLNTTIPSSVLKKKHCAIAYHRTREAIAARAIRFCHVDSEVNLADLMTKPLPNPTFHALVKPLLFRNPGEAKWPEQTKGKETQGE